MSPARSRQKKVTDAFIIFGSSSISAALTERGGAIRPQMINSKESKSATLFRGQPTSLDLAVNQVRDLANKVRGSDTRVLDEFHVLLSHSHLKQYEFETSLYLGPEHDQITEADVRAVHDQTCRVINIPLEEKIMGVWVHEYAVNDFRGVRNPVGLAGERIAVRLSLFTLPQTVVRHLEKIFERAELTIQSWYPRSLAAANALLSNEARRTGALFIWVGSSLSELIGFQNYGICCYQALPAGIETVSSLLQETHSMERSEAVAVTQEYGAFGARAHGEEKIPLHGSGESPSQYLPSYEFNKILDLGLNSIVEEIGKGVENALERFKQAPRVYIAGRGVRLGELIERLEKKCGAEIEVMDEPARNIGHSDDGSIPAVGRAIILQEDEEREMRFQKSIHPLKRILGAALEWMQEHF